MAEIIFSKTTVGLDNKLIQRPAQALFPISLLESTFYALLDRSPHFSWLLGSEGEVVAANQTALAFGEVNLAQAIDRPIGSIWQFSEVDQLRLNSAITAASSGQVIRYEAVVSKESNDAQTTLDLTLCAVAQGAAPPRDESQNAPFHKLTKGLKQPTLLTLVGIDISPRIQLETQLLRNQRLERLGSMTAGIIHDLNNLLTPLRAFTYLFRSSFPEATSQQKELFRVVNTSVDRAQALCKQMLAFIRGETDPFTTVRSDHLLLAVQTLIRGILPASISIKTHIPANLWAIQGNESQLNQVLVNLCLNARDAMPKGGCLELSVENIQVDQIDAVDTSDQAQTHYVAIQVSDTGCGIPNSILNNIFEPFFTTKSKGKGTGLGLSTAMDIITSHGGFIDVFTDSVHPSKMGTRFWVYLPAIAPS